MKSSHRLLMLVLGLSVGLMNSGCTESGSKVADPGVPVVPPISSTAVVDQEIKEPDKSGFPYFEGMVAGKRSSGKSWSVLVIQGLSENEVVHSSWDEIVGKADRNHKAAFYSVTSEQYKQLKVGQMVGMSSTQQEDTFIPQRNTTDMKIIQEPQLVQVTGYRDDIVTGNMLSMDPKKNIISLDISNWVNRHNHGAVNSMMHSINVPIGEDTELVDALGRNIKLSALKVGDKLEMIPAKKWSYDQMKGIPFQAKQVTRLTMTRSEKLDHMLARFGRIHTVVIFEEGKVPPQDEMDFERYVPGAFTGGISWVPYREGEAVDYKKELMLSELPVIIVFDDQDAIYQTDSIRELQKWFNDRAAEG
ncbi:hypothetical protein [Paenibacillus sp. GCM10028914]|uniref:hypothetical protein n=1 Tax=Paenibacillus sp. GCM10028914 TaxID=3273416 RepID=UPI003618EEC4